MRCLAALTLIGLAVVTTGPPVFGRHNFSILEVERQLVTAGMDIPISGFSYTDTVFVRFGSPDGPILAEFEPTENDIVEGVIKIPTDVAPGQYVLYALQQDPEGAPSRLPGQAAVTVVGPGGPPLDSDFAEGFEREARPEDLTAQGDLSSGAFFGIVLVTIAALSLVMMAISRLTLRRRSPLVAQRP